MKRSSVFTAQRGGATLLMTTAMLFAVSLFSLYGAQVTMMEQRISSNFYWTQQAYEGAQAGADAAVALIDRVSIGVNGLANCGSPGAMTGNLTAGATTIGTYAITCTDAGATLSPARPANELLQVSVTSTSTDGATQSFTQLINFTPFAKMVPPAAVIARGQVQGSASLTVDNETQLDEDVTIWSGGNVIGSPSTTTKNGSDGIVKNDANLSSLSGNQFFESFFSERKAVVKNTSNVVTCSGTCGASDLSGLSGIIWVEGNLTLDGATVGSASDPVVLVVEGNLTIRNGSDVYGMVYTDTAWNNGSNTGQITGAVLVNGDFRSNALTITYDKTVLDNLQMSRGVYVLVPGSWRSL